MCSANFLLFGRLSLCGLGTQGGRSNVSSIVLCSPTPNRSLAESSAVLVCSSTNLIHCRITSLKCERYMDIYYTGTHINNMTLVPFTFAFQTSVNTLGIVVEKPAIVAGSIKDSVLLIRQA